MKSSIRTMYDMGLVIRQRRTFLGLSQEALAKRAGVSRSWLAKVELGKASFDFRRILMVTAVMNLHVIVTDAPATQKPDENQERL